MLPMNVALRRPMSLDEFLVWEQGQELRHEFDGLQPVAMTGGTIAHSVIATNIVVALDPKLRQSCRAFQSDLKIIVEGRVRYPDVTVTCAPVADSSDIVPDPVVVFEVLSASKAVVDRGLKVAEYQSTPSIQHYVMVEQTRAEATVLSRDGDGWTETFIAGLTGVVSLSALGVSLSMAEIYRRVSVDG